MAYPPHKVRSLELVFTLLYDVRMDPKFKPHDVVEMTITLGGKPQLFIIHEITDTLVGKSYITRHPTGMVNPLPVPCEFVDALGRIVTP